MTKFKRLAVFLTVALGVTLTPAPAQAAPVLGPALAGSLAVRPASCGGTQLCLYVNSGYETNQGYMLWPVQSAGVCEVLDPYRNAISSMWNSSGRDVRFFKNTTCTGTDYRTLYNGTGNPKISTHWTPTWDNSTDAIQWR